MAARARLPIAEAGVAVLALASAVVLAGMLASPLIPAATPVPLPTAPPPTPTQTPATQALPMGIFVAREPLFVGPCLAIELTPESYAVAAAEGTATIHHWERGMTGCDARTGDVATVPATVEPVMGQPVGGPAGDVIVGYSLRFRLPVGGAGDIPVELAILLANWSEGHPLQVLDTGDGSGQGLVLDRVEVLDLSLNPIPTPAPTPTPAP